MSTDASGTRWAGSVVVRRRMIGALMTTTALLALGCGSPTGPGLPADDPTIEGVIVARDVPSSISGDRPTVHVKGSVDDECGIIFTVTEDTEILRRRNDGSLVEARLDDLVEDLRVRAWSSNGIVFESCPAQAAAEAIEIAGPDEARVGPLRISLSVDPPSFPPGGATTATIRVESSLERDTTLTSSAACLATLIPRRGDEELILKGSVQVCATVITEFTVPAEGALTIGHRLEGVLAEDPQQPAPPGVYRLEADFNVEGIPDLFTQFTVE